MKLFIDTGNVKEVEALAPIGILDGATTNPSLLAKAGDPRAVLKQLCTLLQGPVSAEVVATEADAMVREGHELAGIDPHIVVKVPFGREGLKACGALRRDGIRVNVTLVFSAPQALLAAKTDATFVSPFVGRLDDIASSGMDLIRQIVEIYRNYSFRTEVLVASVRHPIHLVEAGRIGAEICTCPASVIETFFKHPLTDIGLERFLKDWEQSQAAAVKP